MRTSRRSRRLILVSALAAVAVLAAACGSSSKKSAAATTNQHVSLRTYLATQGLKTDPQGGGDVSILPQDNAQTLDTFRSGAIDGAWVPEPWVTRLVQEGGGKVLVDERTLWPGDKFVTTNLLVSTKFLKAHPDVVERLLKGLVQTIDTMKA